MKRLIIVAVASPLLCGPAFAQADTAEATWREWPRGRGYGGRRFVSDHWGFGLGCPYYAMYAWPYACTY
jgi:hypothetical protein